MLNQFARELIAHMEQQGYTSGTLTIPIGTIRRKVKTVESREVKLKQLSAPAAPAETQKGEGPLNPESEITSNGLTNRGRG